MSQQINLPERFVEEAKEICSISQFPMDEIIAIFSLKMDHIQVTGEKLTDPQAMAWKRTKLTVKNEYKSVKDEPVRYIYVCGDSGVTDQLDFIRKKAESAIKKDADKAFGDGLIDYAHNILDTRKTLFGKSANPDFGMPLSANKHEWQRDILGLVSDTPTFDEVEIASIRAFGEKAEDMPVTKLWRFYEFKAKEKVSKDPDAATAKVYNMVKGTRFSMIADAVQSYELLNKINLQTTDDVIALYASVEKYNKDMVDRGMSKEYMKKIPLVAVQGYVQSFYEKEGSQTKSITITGDGFQSDELLGYLPASMPLEVTEGWEIVEFGRPMKTNDVVKLNIAGYMVKSKD